MYGFLKNPLSYWFLWYIKSRKILLRNKKKHLKIGYLTNLNNVKIGDYNTFYNNVKVSNTVLDDFVYVTDGTIISNAHIGKFCSIGPNVKIGLGMHPTNLISTFPAFFSTNKQCQISFTDRNYFEEIGSIKIGNDVWIGANVIIMDNVVIGDGAIIAAGAVVTKNVAPYNVVGGIPAKLIKKRFDDEQIQQLLELKWWDKELEWLKSNIRLFNNPDSFFKTFKLKKFL